MKDVGKMIEQRGSGSAEGKREEKGRGAEK